MSRVRWSGTEQVVLYRSTFSAASRGLFPFQEFQVDGCEITSGCRLDAPCHKGPPGREADTTDPAHAVQGKQGQQRAVYQSNVYAVCVTLAKVMMSMPDCRKRASGPRARRSGVTALSQQDVLCFERCNESATSARRQHELREGCICRE